MFQCLLGKGVPKHTKFYERLVQHMNGINYSTLMGNTGFLANQVAADQKDTKYKVTTSSKDKTKNVKLTNGQDTVEINGKSRDIPKAGYSRPIAASKAAKAKDNEVKTTGKIVNTNYCKNRDAFSSNAAYDEYNKLLWQVMNDGGIDSGILNAYLNQGKSQGVFSSKDVKAIKSQFGI